ncbi:putative short chain type dehydrogenase [Didymella exigua CBS 183.55]|uniref:Putative short chain type dehydrogenase n=1 Tax=Didymella exigua CBS 183.55 TaxID=1150837 RepID=A0A6A5RBY2_9PLEO|nr:putative short chain type dehydrogenase [Didymella exigua CBS 183.55]KAF1924879.1 putative short chain type dehydrogenase [Didymella exigua CBS 183.55]
MPGRLEKKIAVVTGASSGIGRAISLAFASHGATVICSDLREEARIPGPSGDADSSQPSTVSAITSSGGTAIFVKCDTTSASDVEALVKSAVQKYGRLDIMVNNAGIAVETGSSHGPRPVWEYDESAFEKTLGVNVKGVFLGIKYAAAAMKDQDPHPNGDRGWIVNLASVFGLGGGPNSSGYITSKHAVMGLTKASAWDCAPHRIHVNALCPGYTQTAFTAPIWQDPEATQRLEAMHPFKGLGTPEDVARAAVFLASEDAGWVTGVGLPVDGGYSSM